MLAGLVLAGSLTLTAAPVADAAEARRSSRWSELQRKIRDTQRRIREARARERGIIAQINASDVRRQRLEDVLDALWADLADAQTRLKVLDAAAGKAAVELDMRTRDLEETMATLDEQTQLMNSRAADKYMTGPTTFTPVLFNATEFSDFLSAEQFVRSTLKEDASIIEQIRTIRDEIQSDRAEIGARKKAIEEQASLVKRERDNIAAIRSKQVRAKRAIDKEINYRKSLLSRVRDERQAFEEALQSYLRESDSIAGILRDAQRGQRVIQGAGRGYLVWPVSGRISSGYGWREHPIYHRRSFHTGIDIAAPAGTRVVASRAGRVVYTGYRGAFGLIVLIDHGQSVATMYAHLSRASVRSGQQVRRGATVGSVGCTGWCTGPHVHFEVRVQGDPRNPMAWL